MLKRLLLFLLIAAMCPAVFFLFWPKNQTIYDDAFLDGLGNAYLVCYDSTRLFICRYSENGELTGRWEYPRYNEFNYTAVGDMCFDNSGRVFCLLNSVDSRTYDCMEQSWLELVNYSDTKVLDTQTDSGINSIFGSALYYDNGLLSFSYNRFDLIFRDSANRFSFNIPLDGIRYMGTAFFLTRDKMLLSDTVGGLYIMDTDGTYAAIRERSEGPVSALLPGKDGTFYWLYNNMWMRGSAAKPGEYTPLPDLEPDIDFIINDKNYLAWGGDGLVYVRENAGDLPLPLPSFLPQYGFHASIIIGVFLGGCAAALLQYRKNKRSSLLWKILFPTAVVLTSGSVALLFVFGALFEENHITQKTERALLSAQRLADNIDIPSLLSIDWNNPAQSDYFSELYDMVQYRVSGELVKKLLPDDSYETLQYLGNVYFAFFVPDGDALNIVICDSYFCNTPVAGDSRIGREYLQLLKNPALPVPLTGFEEPDLDWLSIGVPVVDEDGKMVGLIETGFSKRQYQYETERTKYGLLTQIVIVADLILLFLTVYLMFMLSSLKKLRFALEAIENGDYSVSVPVRGHDEVSAVSSAVNTMSKQIDHSTFELQTLNNAYARFLPREVLLALGQKSVLTAKRGQNRHITSIILHIHILRFNRITKDMPQDTVFHFVNKISQIIIGTVMEHGGVVEGYRQHEYVCLFEDADMALDAAIAISRGLAALSPSPELTQVVVKGGVLLGIAGHDERLGTLMISDILQLSEQLGRFGADCGARIVFTGDASPGKPYFRRSLGRMPFDGGSVDVYECFEGDEQPVFMGKKTFTALFEQGVNLYSEGEWEKSKLTFIKYIKETFPDAAAKHFLFLCDKETRRAEEK